MKRWAIGRDGFVVNVVQGEAAPESAGDDVFEDLSGTLSVGGTYDRKDFLLDRADVVIHQILFRVVNDVRELKLQVPLTQAQYRAFVKGLMT